MQPSLERQVNVFKLVVVRQDVVQVISSVWAAVEPVSQWFSRPSIAEI